VGAAELSRVSRLPASTVGEDVAKAAKDEDPVLEDSDGKDCVIKLLTISHNTQHTTL
jgi:hypothetical protein